ncbi:nectin-4 isoform X2 [Protopterus annectens]|uniref:nectin-4 isoform X2 n=1 Tax=Protopterus annectens TaxID=7888 RepID=UPI001CFC2219|nr:nectin-4 isoform X2 [Protopterus annectens]
MERTAISGSKRVTKQLHGLLCLLLCHGISTTFIPKDPKVIAIFGQQVVLPCLFQESDNRVQVVQVNWYLAPPGASREEIAVIHDQHGLAVHDSYKDRVERYAKSVAENGAIVLKTVAVADEGQYVCRVTTFPSGTFENTVTLSVFMAPLMTLKHVPELTERLKSTAVASCVAEARPIPSISWETELEGTWDSKTVSLGNVEVITSDFILWPHRSMNGKELICVVTHPALSEPKRMTYKMNVRYPPDVTIKRDTDWYIGLVGGTLKCIGDGNPVPTNYTWRRQNGSFSEGVKIEKGILKFEKPLTEADSGIYFCSVANEVGRKESQTEILVHAAAAARHTDFVNTTVIVIGVVAVVLIALLAIAVGLVTRYHRKKKKELTIKLEEFSTLSRGNSIRRVNSISIRTQGNSFNLPSQIDELERRSSSTIATVREIEVQTEMEVLTSQEADEALSSTDSHGEIQTAMTHFYPENGTLRPKPTCNGIYITRKENFV